MSELPVEPSVVAIAFLALSGVATAVLVLLLALGASGALPTEEFVRQNNKLLRAGNVDRALKLCDAAGARPVAVLMRIGLSACGQGDIPMEGLVERARMAMAQQLPAMQARALRDLVIAVIVAGALTSMGVVAALVVVQDPSWMAPLLGCAAIVDVLAIVVVSGRLRLRGDLGRVVTDFGRA